MKRETLEALGLTADQIDAVMKENGADINREKAKYADYEDIKTQLETANKTLDGMKDYEQAKADVLKYQQAAEAAQKEAAAKVERLQLQTRIKEFTGGKKFVNDLTREAINTQIENALADAANKGKSIEDLFNGIIEGKTDILKDENGPTPPVAIPMAAAQQPAGNAQPAAASPLKASWNRFKG